MEDISQLNRISSVRNNGTSLVARLLDRLCLEYETNETLTIECDTLQYECRPTFYIRSRRLAIHVGDTRLCVVRTNGLYSHMLSEDDQVYRLVDMNWMNLRNGALLSADYLPSLRQALESTS